jgi:hypothetical protein
MGLSIAAHSFSALCEMAPAFAPTAAKLSAILCA